MVPGSGATEEHDEKENSPGGAVEIDVQKSADYSHEGVPGPITRLFVIANRGVANLVQDLILVSCLHKIFQCTVNGILKYLVCKYNHSILICPLSLVKFFFKILLSRFFIKVLGIIKGFSLVLIIYNFIMYCLNSVALISAHKSCISNQI